MKPEEFDRAVQRGEVGPLYFLYGEEQFLVDRGVKRLLDRVVDPDTRDFNFTLFYGNECSGEDIVAAAQTFPMFADRRVVLVRKGSELSAAAMESLANYVVNPSPSTCLILQGGKADMRKKFYVELKKRGEIVEFKRPYENQLGAFIAEETASRGKRVEPAAAAMLAYLVGNNLLELASQLDKVVTFVGERNAIRVDDIRQIVSDTKVDSVFELANALGERNLAKCLRCLQTLLRDGEAPLMILAMVIRHFRQLWLVRELLDRKESPQEISRLTGIHSFFLKGMTAQAGKYRVADFRRAFERFYGTDLALKTGGGKPSQLMESLIMDICSGSVTGSGH